jgi:hypothetical protein
MSSRVVGAVAAMVFLLGAAGVAVYVATRAEPLIQPPPAADGPAPAPSASAPAPAPVSGDVARLSERMKACEADAAREPKRLHLLVTPLVTSPRHLEDWKTLAINQLGNAIAIGSQDVLGGLKAGTLSISKEPYTFTLRDEATRKDQRWEAIAGIQPLSMSDDVAIRVFRLQYAAQGKAPTEDWGRPVQRQPNQCHWINVLPLP